MDWMSSLDKMRKLSASVLVPNRGRPILGRDDISDSLESYRDVIQFVHDQTLRFANKGNKSS